MPDIGDLDEVTDNFVQVCGKHCVFQNIIVNIPAMHAMYSMVVHVLSDSK